MDDRSKALARRRARIEGHLRAGKTSGEICDIEGLDSANEPKRMKKDVADPLGLTIPSGHNTAPPVGLLDIDTQFRAWIGDEVRVLRRQHHYVDVAQMIGLTNIEQMRAVERPYAHNWTLSQLQRLAVARGMTLPELIAHCQRPAAVDFRLKGKA
jgi:hypothetical protein